MFLVRGWTNISGRVDARVNAPRATPPRIVILTLQMLEDEREGLVARARAGTPAEGAEAYESEIEALRGLVLEQVANTERFVQANLVLAKAAAEHEAQLAALRAAEDDLQRRANALQLTNARLTRDSATAQDTITRLTAELEQAKR